MDETIQTLSHYHTECNFYILPHTQDIAHLERKYLTEFEIWQWALVSKSDRALSYSISFLLKSKANEAETKIAFSQIPLCFPLTEV